MLLTDKARDFIRGGTSQSGPNELTLLSECIEEGTIEALYAVQMLFEDMYGGFTFNYELKAPAAFCLVRWGAPGLEALVEAAQRTPESKNHSLAIEILGTLAAAEKLPQVTKWIRDEHLSKRVLELTSDWEELFTLGRRLLVAYLLSFEEEDELLLAIGTQFQKLGLIGPSIAGSLVAAMAARWLAISIPTLEAFRMLIRDHANDEPRFQAFLERHPQLIDPMAFEVWPQPSIHGAKEPDFVIRRTDDTYLVVEIETPSKPMVTKSNKLTADATHAVAQATDYASFLVERFQSIRQQLPSFRQPECLVVIGMEFDLNADQARALQIENENRHRLRIVGFDWLVRRAESIVNNVIAHRVTLTRSLRIT